MTTERTHPIDQTDPAAPVRVDGVRARLAVWLHTRPWRTVGLTVLSVVWVAAYQLNGPAWDHLLYDLVGMDGSARLTESLHFFGYDTVKITLMLVGIIFVVTVARSNMSVERTRALLGGKREGVGNVLAAGLGVATSFCSCSAVPAFIGFVAAGVPIGVTFTASSKSSRSGLTWSDVG